MPDHQHDHRPNAPVESHAGHGHEGHDHSGHSHAPASFGKAFAIGSALNIGFVIAEVWYGLAAHSVALLADAGHNLADVSGLLLAWGASHMATRQPTFTRTYGWGRSTILASLINAVVLLIGCGAIALEAMHRFNNPQPVAGGTVMWVAALGILINGVTAMLFMRGRKGDLNIKGAYLHMAADAAVSAGVVVAALAIQFTGWLWIDPVTSLVIVVVIIAGTWGLLRDSFSLAMDEVPAGIELHRVEASLQGLPGVIEVHDLHVWALSTTETALSAHLVHDGSADTDTLFHQATDEVKKHYRIGHSTIQVETAVSAELCRQRPATVI